MARSSATGAERWDCHVHVFGPAARFPYAARRRYTPWGSDRPHVLLEGGPDAPREVDTPALLAALRGWTGGEALDRVLAVNPAALYAR